MSVNNHHIHSLTNLLDYDIRRFISTETFLRNHLPLFINKTGSLKLRTVLQHYFNSIEEHLDAVRKLTDDGYSSGLSLTNRIMQAFIEEMEERLSLCTDEVTRDACLLESVQVINHFKISSYGTAAAFAQTLGMEEQAHFFYEAEMNEKDIDRRLSELAEHDINLKAKAPILLPGY